MIVLDNTDEFEYFISQELPKIKDIGQILILYHTEAADFVKKIQVSNQIPNALFVDIDELQPEEYLNCLAYNHCLLISNTAIHLPECSLEKCVYELERTYAAAFFFGLTKSSFKACNEAINYGPYPEATIDYRLVFLSNGIAAWQFAYETYVWEDPALLNAVLLRKENVEAIVHGGFNKEAIKKYMHTIMAQDREIGLFLDDYCNNLSINIVSN